MTVLPDPVRDILNHFNDSQFPFGQALNRLSNAEIERLYETMSERGMLQPLYRPITRSAQPPGALPPR